MEGLEVKVYGRHYDCPKKGDSMKTFICFNNCGFETVGATKLHTHYLENPTHRPPYWETRNRLAKAHKEQKKSKTNTAHKQGYECFKKCGFVGNLHKLITHYKQEPTHHRHYGELEEYRKHERDSKRQRRYSHLSVVGSKVKIGKEVGFRKGKAADSKIANLREQLSAEISRTVIRLESLRFALEVLTTGEIK